jgi:hypothetical protein
MASLKREWWGPRFWRVLHTLAEASGGMQSPILSNDEADAWKLVFKTQTFVMPCAVCQKHFTEWKIQNRIPELRGILGIERRAWLRHWLWGCHCRVNEMSSKECPPEDVLPDLFKKERIDEPMADLISMFRLATQQGTLKYEDTVSWRNAIAKLRTLYSI